MKKEPSATTKERTQSFSELSGKAKMQYLFDYYKLPFFIACIVIYIVIYILYGYLSKKNEILYIAFSNVTIGDTLQERLSSDYLTYSNLDISQNEIYTYQNLYVSDNPSDENTQYAYASSTKILAAIDCEKLDVVLMNEEAKELFLSKDYLTNLSSLIDSDSLNCEDPYTINLTNVNLFREAELSDQIYLGIIDNSPRKHEATNYVTYLLKE